ncbi:unnamed protein product [Durusdinium trenchii]|uniref:Uncharacterized protein n=1 Tax=Durusdinium trenchii TaxID=1381693 RepID=A0ABP0Q3E0_9DINO
MVRSHHVLDKRSSLFDVVAHFGFQDFQSSFVQDWIPDMARRMLAPWVALACFFAMGYTFLAPPKAEIPVAALTAAMAPAAAQAMDMPEVGSTLNLSAPLETVMLGIVLGTVPITVFGLLVSAWLQFKKGPTLGI